MSMKIMYGGPPPPGVGRQRLEEMKREAMKKRMDQVGAPEATERLPAADIEDPDEAPIRQDMERQVEFLRLAGVPDDVAHAALGMHATYRGRFDPIDLLRAIADLARHGAFIERRWARRVKLVEARMDFARQALEGKLDDEL
jgi:hypothetical protein